MIIVIMMICISTWPSITICITTLSSRFLELLYFIFIIKSVEDGARERDTNTLCLLLLALFKFLRRSIRL